MAEIENFIDYFYDARRYVEDEGKERENDWYRKYRTPWGMYREGLESYSESFAEVMEESLEAFLHRRKEMFGHVFLLDVMGQGGFSETVRLDGEVAMTLIDFRSDDTKTIDDEQNKLVVDGDILHGRNWGRVRTFMKENEPDMNSGFDLVTCRPFGGWDLVVRRDGVSNKDFTRYSSSMEWFLADRMFQLLSPNGGMMVMEMNHSSDYGVWKDVLNDTPGIEAEYASNLFSPLIRIFKHTDTLPRLPRIPLP